MGASTPSLQTIGQRPGRDRQALAGEPRGNAVHGTEAGTGLEQKARPEAGPVERSGEQPRHRGADTSMGDDAHSQVRRQRGRRITRLWALTSIPTRVDSSAPFGA